MSAILMDFPLVPGYARGLTCLQQVRRSPFGTTCPIQKAFQPTSPRTDSHRRSVVMHSPLNSGISRRSFFRFAAGASALAAMPIVTEAHLAQAQRGRRLGDPNKGVHIDSNENPLGPCDAARQAAHAMVDNGGRYYFDMEYDLVDVFARQEGLDPKSIRVY